MVTGHGFLVLLYFLYSVGSVFCQPVLTPPPESEGQDAGVTIVSGAYLTFDQYQAIGVELQQRFDGRLWVYLINGPLLYNESRGHIEANETYVGQGKDALIAAGMPPDAVYFAIGHSLGSVIAYDEVRSYPELAQGVILWAGLMNLCDIDTYPTPLLLVCGDMDGSLTPGEITPCFKQVRGKIDAGEEGLKYRYPHVVLRGVNHAQYATGNTPSNVVSTWIEPEVSNETARQLIANGTLTFMHYLIADDDGVRDDLEDVMDEYYAEARLFYDPVIEVFEAEAMEEAGTSPWVDTTQIDIAALNGSDQQLLQTRNYVVTSDVIGQYQPNLTVEDDGSISTVTYTSIVQPGISSQYVSADGMETKVKSNQAVVEAITGEEVPNNPPVTCRGVNEGALSYVWNNLTSPLQQQRFLSRNITIVFLDDAIKRSGPEWLESDLVFDYNFPGRNLTIQSSSLLTDTTGVAPDEFLGQHYCKQLSPARLLEFIQTHALYEYYYQ